MRLLVLGGSHFVGHAAVAEGLARGWDVTVANRGLSGRPQPGARPVTLDRTRPGAFEALAAERFDVVLDTWSSAPSVVRDAARALASSTDRWVYVSSRSVYSWPVAPFADESAPVVDGDPDSDATDYAADKRGGELAADRELGADRVIHLRAGLILGPRDNVGRLPWWLRRVARGGETLAPAPASLPIQYVDPRDLVALGLDAAVAGRHGPVDVVCPPATSTLDDVLSACVRATGSDTAFTWIDPAWLLAQGVEIWTELPIWIPESEEAYAMHQSDVSRALEWGLRVRPVGETVAACWAWVQEVDAAGTAPPPREGIGMGAEREVELLARWRAQAGSE